MTQSPRTTAREERAAATATHPAGSARPKWLPVAALFSVSVIWGGTFVWMKEGLDEIALRLEPSGRNSGLLLFLGLRFALAALCVFAISRSARTRLSRDAWRGGLWLGAPLLAGFTLQMSGLTAVSPAVSAFLTSLYVLFTALMTAVIAKKGLRAPLAIGAALATIGAGVIRGRPELGFTTGEVLTIGAAFVFAVHILATDHVTKRVDPMAVTFTSLLVVAAGSGVLLALAQLDRGAPSASQLLALATTREFLVPLALMTTLGTVVALSFMNLFQREIDPVRAAILYALEPLWATVFGLAAGLDRLTPWLWVGGSILLAGNLFAELGLKLRRPRA
jgi:drug/metabolite transporter (DMT)-like permease